MTLADAIRLTLEHHPQIAIQQQQVEYQRGILRSAAGQFDLQLLADASQGRAYRPLTGYEQFLYSQYDKFAATASATNVSRVVLGVSKEFRNGILVSPTLSASRVIDNLQNRKGMNQGNIQFSVTLPLLRGRGRTAVDAQERMSASQLDAALFEVDETISNLLATTANSYWSVLAAEKQLETLRGSESRASALLENTKHLIEADRLPRSDINQVLAIQAIRRASLIAAEQQVVEAKENLAVNMGVGQDAVMQMPEVVNEFPPEGAVGPAWSAAETQQAYIQLALDRRPELRALKKREEASRTGALAAQNGVRPQLDVTLSPGVTGLAEGSGITQFTEGPAYGARGLDFSGAITYRFPVRRDGAAGALQASNALARQASLQYEDAARQTAAAVIPAVSGLAAQSRQREQTRASVGFYQKALEAEQERLQVGAGTVINLITIDDQLTTATQQDIAAQLAYAQALVRLRLVTSTIVRPGAQGGAVDPGVFSTPPAPTDTPQTPVKPQAGSTP